MQLILVGCEYTGTTTLAKAIHEWAEVNMGKGFRLIHDHFKQPDTAPHGPALTDEELQRFQALSPRLREVIQRHNLYYHTPQESSSDLTTLYIGLHIDEAIYGPLYYGYGGPGLIGDRSVISQHIEHRIMKHTPETVLVLIKASPDVITRRMREAPHKHQVIREEDIERVLTRFEEEHWRSLIARKITLDTSTMTITETVAEFANKIQPHLTQVDLARLLLNRK